MIKRGLRVQRAERFVQQEDPWAGREGTHDPDSLLHPTGQTLGKMVLESRQTRQAEKCLRRRAPLVLRDALHLETELDVLPHRLPGEERVLLKDHAAICAGLGDHLAIDADAPGGRLQETRKGVEERGLAAARGADDRHELAWRDIDGDVADGEGRALPWCRSSGRSDRPRCGLCRSPAAAMPRPARRTRDAPTARVVRLSGPRGSSGTPPGHEDATEHRDQPARQKAEHADRDHAHRDVVVLHQGIGLPW